MIMTVITFYGDNMHRFLLDQNKHLLNVSLSNEKNFRSQIQKLLWPVLTNSTPQTDKIQWKICAEFAD
jgi:hypothetical protein